MAKDQSAVELRREAETFDRNLEGYLDNFDESMKLMEEELKYFPYKSTEERRAKRARQRKRAEVPFN